MKASIQQRLVKAKHRIERRLDGDAGGNGGKPMFAARNIRYGLADKTQAIGVGGIGVVHRLAQEIGLVEAIDRHVHVMWSGPGSHPQRPQPEAARRHPIPARPQSPAAI